MFARNKMDKLWLFASLALVLLLGICNGTNHTDATPIDAVESANQAASATIEAAKKEASPPTFADKVKESLGKAGQQLQGYAGQLTAQIPKRLRRRADHQHSEHSNHHQANNEQHRGQHDSHAHQHDTHNHHARLLHRLRRQAAAPAQQPPPPAGFLSGGQSAANALAAFGEQVRNQTTAVAGAAVQQFQNLRDQLAAGLEKQAPGRVKRQIQYPSGQQPEAASSPSTGSGVMKYISDLGQQAQQAQAISQFLQAAGASGSQGPSGGPSGPSGSQSSGGTQVAQVLTQLTDLIKSTQNRNARLVESSQRSLEATGQQTMDAAKSAQSGFQAAISEMTQGLQKLAANNPNLVPDIKSLYQSVSSKLSPTASSAQASAAIAPSQAAPSA